MPKRKEYFASFPGKRGPYIKKLLRLRGFKTARSFWEKVNPNITAHQFSRWMNPNENTDIPGELWEEVARVLEIDPDIIKYNLFDEYDDLSMLFKNKIVPYLKHSIKDIPVIKRLIPVIGSVSCGNPYPDNSQIIQLEMIRLPESITSGGLDEYFAATADGDSNANKIEDGDYIIIRRCVDIENFNNGNLGYFCLHETDFFIRALYIQESPGHRGIVLQSLNPRQDLYPRIILQDEQLASLRIYGKIVYILKNLTR